jgi:hypothetical protein
VHALSSLVPVPVGAAFCACIGGWGSVGAPALGPLLALRLGLGSAALIFLLVQFRLACLVALRFLQCLLLRSPSGLLGRSTPGGGARIRVGRARDGWRGLGRRLRGDWARLFTLGLRLPRPLALWRRLPG